MVTASRCLRLGECFISIHFDNCTHAYAGFQVFFPAHCPLSSLIPIETILLPRNALLTLNSCFSLTQTLIKGGASPAFPLGMTKQSLSHSACPEQVNTAALSLCTQWGIQAGKQSLSTPPQLWLLHSSGPSSGIVPDPGGRGDTDVLFKIRALYSH